MRLKLRRGRVVLAATAVAAVSALGVIGWTHTLGFLNVSSTNAANSVTAGTVKVGAGGSGAIVTMSAGKPGTTTCGEATVTSSGTLPGQFELSESHITGNSGTGTLGRALQLQVTQDPATYSASACTVTGGTSVYGGAFDSLSPTKLTGLATAGTGHSAGDWLVGEQHTFAFVVAFPSSGVAIPSPGSTPAPTPSDNAYQAQTVSAEFDWYGTQSRATVVTHS